MPDLIKSGCHGRSPSDALGLAVAISVPSVPHRGAAARGVRVDDEHARIALRPQTTPLAQRPPSMAASSAAAMNQAPQPVEYFRRDRPAGITAPDLSKDCTYAEHIVRARGKRTRFTSVSRDPERIREFGDQLYKLQHGRVIADAHVVVEHSALVDSLRASIRGQDKADRARAVQALRYALMRTEGLVDWRFDTSGVERKDLLAWAEQRVRPYFTRA